MDEKKLGYLALDEDDYIKQYVENYLHIPLKLSTQIKRNYEQQQAIINEISTENLTFFASQDKLTGLTPEMYMFAFVAMPDGVPVNYKEAMESVEWCRKRKVASGNGS
jgi:hypothetical protein